MTAKINIEGVGEFTVESIDGKPQEDEDQNQILEFIKVTLKEPANGFKERRYYSGKIWGKNSETGEEESHSFTGFKLDKFSPKELLFIHSNFSFNYQLDMFLIPRNVCSRV